MEFVQMLQVYISIYLQLCPVYVKDNQTKHLQYFMN